MDSGPTGAVSYTHLDVYKRQRYGWNVAAIRTLRALEAEDRSATLQAQETLSRYAGWGGIPQAFDAQNEDLSLIHI